MKYQKEINVEKFKRMWWKYENGKLKAEQSISRDPFGKFDITFRQCIENGAVVMEITQKAFPSLNRTPVGYESFEKAVNALAEYFKGIDEQAKNIPQEVKDSAKRAYELTIAKEIVKNYGEVI